MRTELLLTACCLMPLGVVSAAEPIPSRSVTSQTYRFGDWVMTVTPGMSHGVVPHVPLTNQPHYRTVEVVPAAGVNTEVQTGVATGVQVVPLGGVESQPDDVAIPPGPALPELAASESTSSDSDADLLPNADVLPEQQASPEPLDNGAVVPSSGVTSDAETAGPSVVTAGCLDASCGFAGGLMDVGGFPLDRVREYQRVYDSIPFSRAEYDANPSYRHDATMEFLFGQMRPTVIERRTTRVDVNLPQWGFSPWNGAGWNAPGWYAPGWNMAGWRHPYPYGINTFVSPIHTSVFPSPAFRTYRYR